MSDRAVESGAPRGLGHWRPSPRVWRVAFAIVLAQLVYWFAVHPVLLVPPQKPATYETSNPRAATLSAPTLAALAAADFEPAELPWSDCCAGYRAFAVDWTLEAIPPGGIGVVPNVDADNVMVVVNGQLVYGQGRMAMEEVTHHRLRTILFVSPGLLRTGTNEIALIMVRSGTGLPYFDVGRAPIVGDYKAMVEAYGWRLFVLNDYVVITYTIGFVLAGLALLVLIRSQRRAFPFWVFALALSWSALTQFYLWTEPPFDPTWRIVYYFALTNLIPLAWLNLADAWSERQTRWIAPLSADYFGAALSQSR